MPNQEQIFASLDLLLDSLGYEMERGEPVLGNTVTADQVKESAAPPSFDPPSEDLGFGSENMLGDAEPEPEDEPVEEESFGGAPSGDDAVIEAMLADAFDSPAVGSEESGGGDFLDLSGGSSSPSFESDDFGASDDSGSTPSAEDYTQSKLADAPMWDDTPKAPPEPEPEPEEPEPEESEPEPEEPEPEEPEPEDSESELDSELESESVPDFSDDTFGTDFAKELESTDLGDLGDDAAASQDEDAADDLSAEEEDEAEEEDADVGADELGGDEDMASFAEEMESFAEELEAMDIPDAEAPAASGDFDLGDSFSDGSEQLPDDFAGADLGGDSGGLDSLSGFGEAESGFAEPSEPLSSPSFADVTGTSPSLGGGSFESQAFDDVDLGFGAGVAIPNDPKSGNDYSEDALELDDDDLQRIRKRMMIMTPRLRELVTRAISEDTIKPQSQNRLIRMLLNKAPLDEVRVFIENETGESAAEETVPGMEDPFGGYIPGGDPARASSGVSALSNIWPMLRIGALAAAVVVFGLLLYLLLIRPGMTGSGLMQRGLVAINDMEYTDAENYFERGEAYLGQDIDWYRKYANAYRNRSEYGRAIRKIRDGLAFAPKDFDSLMFLGDTYIETKDFDAAQETFRQLEKHYPESLKIPEKLGDVYLAMGDAGRGTGYYEQARTEYQKILDKEWKNLDGQFKTLLAYVKMRKLPEAEEKYKQINRIKKNAMNAPILTEYAGLLQDNKKWYDSRTVLFEVLDKHWLHAPAQYRLGKYYRDQLDYGKAYTFLDNAVRIDGNNATYHNELGEVLLSSPRPDVPAAIQSFTLARELAPDYPAPYINLGHIYYDYLTPGDSGDLNLEERYYDQALENYISAVNLMPADFNDQKLFYNLGWLHYRKNRYEDSVTAWQRLYTENPFHPVVSFGMGNAWLHLGKDELAEAEYEKVIRYYQPIADRIPVSSIDYDIKRHRNVYGMLINSLNNRGVAWEMRHQRSNDPEWEKQALMSFWRARELADRLKKDAFEFPEVNIRYILHREYRRGLTIAPELGKGTIPKFLDHELH